MTRRRTAAALIAAGILTLAGCAGAAQDDERPRSPIDQYMSAGDSGLSDAEREAEGDEWLRENEELIAACMNEQGFEYVAHPPTPTGFDFNTLDSPDLDDREWVQRYGYGVVHAPERAVETVAADPNEQIVASLTPAETAAYYAALSGGSNAYTADGDYVAEKAGCQGTAQIELDGRDPLASDEFRPLRDAVMDFYAEAQATPEIAEIDARWAECMDAAGHGPYTAQSDPLIEINVDLLTVLSDEGDSAWESPEMEKLGAREIELALADLACREETDYRDRHAGVMTTLEERFVEDHLADLEAFKAAAEQAGS